MTSGRSAKPMGAGTVAKLRQKRQKLLDLYYADKITPAVFAEEELSLTRQIKAHEDEAHEAHRERQRQSLLSDHFERVATLLETSTSTGSGKPPGESEKRTLINALIEAVVVYPDRLQVAINGAPPLTVDFEEVGLRPAGMRTMVSKGV